MFRLFHSADWQLGARISQLNAGSVRPREARLRIRKVTVFMGTVDAASGPIIIAMEPHRWFALGELNGDPTREVFMDEQRQDVGIGSSRDALRAFDQRSQGAKEQLLLCRCVAVAQELATDEPQVLILDDVLVNADPLRQEIILEILAAQAVHLQILILTCPPDRYRGVGQFITITV